MITLHCTLCFFQQDEITEMKRKLKIMNHQIDQLKEEISSKDAALVKEHLEHQRVEKEKESLKAELQRMKQQASESKAYIEAQEAEERKLLKIIAEADAERVRQKKELDQVSLTCKVYSLLTFQITVIVRIQDIFFRIVIRMSDCLNSGNFGA